MTKQIRRYDSDGDRIEIEVQGEKYLVVRSCEQVEEREYLEVVEYSRYQDALVCFLEQIISWEATRFLDPESYDVANEGSLSLNTDFVPA